LLLLGRPLGASLSLWEKTALCAKSPLQNLITNYELRITNYLTFRQRKLQNLVNL
jgi:hypothetical protein